LKGFVERARKRGASATSEGKEPVILVHAFSNGGSHSAVQLAQAYRTNIQAIRSSSASSPDAQSDFPPELPVSALVLDSAPGVANFFIGVNVALSVMPKSATLSRWLFAPVACLVIAGIQSAHYLGIAEDIASKIWRCLNDPRGPFLVKNGLAGGATIVPRAYLFSTSDEMTMWQGVHEHALEARRVANEAVRRGGSANGHANGGGVKAVKEDFAVEDWIRLDGFPGTAHVNHVKNDPGRYWRVVRETLEKGMAG
jgi:hypothetical protein